MKNTKIKFSEKNQEKIALKLRRAKYFVTISPPRFLYPYKTFLFQPFFILSETDNTVIANVQALTTLRKVNNVQVDYPKDGMVTFNFSKASLLSELPADYIVARLKSFNDIQSNQWAIMIENFHKNYKESFENAHNALESASSSFEKNRFSIEDNTENDEIFKEATFWMNITYYLNEIIYDSVVYTKELIKLFGYDVDDFIKIALNNGLPPMFKKHEEFNKIVGPKVFRQLYYFEFDKMESPDEMITNYGGRVKVNKLLGTFAKKLDNNCISTKHFIKISVYEKENLIKKHLDESPYYIKDDQVEKQLQAFNNKFYPPNIISKPEDIIDESKICKIKELTEKEQNKFKSINDEVLLKKYFPGVCVEDEIKPDQLKRIKR